MYKISVNRTIIILISYIYSPKLYPGWIPAENSGPNTDGYAKDLFTYQFTGMFPVPGSLVFPDHTPPVYESPLGGSQRGECPGSGSAANQTPFSQ
jgi:hypothetical protein